MRMSWKIGRVAGIDLYLHSTFLLGLAYIGATQGGLDAVLLVSAVFGCVLLHELGHALTARLYGIPTEDITLYPIGGVARLRRLPRKPGAELLITLAGPAVNVAIAGTLAVLLWIFGSGDPYAPQSYAYGFFQTLMAINAFLAAFNLIPAFPMDGGRILRALLAGWLGRLRATEIAAGIGQALAIVFGAWSLSSGSFVHVALAVFIGFVAQRELWQVREEEEQGRPKDDHRGDEVWTAPPGYRWVPAGQGAWRLAPVYVTVGPRKF